MNINNLRKDVHQLLRKWHKSNLPDLKILPNLTSVTRAKIEYAEPLSEEERLALSIKKVVRDSIIALEAQNPDLGTVLKRRFLDDVTIRAVADEMNVSEFTISRWQRDGIEQVVEILEEQERELLQANVDQLEAKLPPQTYQTLIGRTDILQQLLEQVKVSKINMACLTGYGGVGKSSLANSLARALIQEGSFTDIIWFSQEDLYTESDDIENIFPMVISHLLTYIDSQKDIHLTFETKLQYVRRALRQNRYLVVLDNFNDKDGLTYLVERLNDIVGRSFFLFTSRARPSGNTATIKEITGLSANDAQALFYLLLEQRGQNIDEFNDADINEIYEKLGGNPLAITIFVSLLDIVPADYVLKSLNTVGSTSDRVLTVIDQMWQIISDDARYLLQGMGLVSEEGATLTYLHALFRHRLPDSERRLLVALGELASSSLIIILGTKEKRYKLHPLTRTFVNRQINHLETDDEE